MSSDAGSIRSHVNADRSPRRSDGHVLVDGRELRRADSRRCWTGESYQAWPAGDAHARVQAGGEQHEEQQGEEEGGAAHKLEEVQGGAPHTAVHHFLQDEGHEGQQLKQETPVRPYMGISSNIRHRLTGSCSTR